MAIDIDAFAVLGSIAAHPTTFSDVTADAAKAARTLTIKQITRKGSNLETLRGVRKALGGTAFSLILDGVPDSQIKTLITRLDKNHPDLKTSDPQWRLKRLSALVDGTAEPTSKPPAAPKRQSAKKAKPEQPAELELLRFESAGAKRKR